MAHNISELDPHPALPGRPPVRRAVSASWATKTQGVPDEHVASADACVEIPMVGSGASLNVAVAGPGPLVTGSPESGDQPADRSVCDG